MPALALGPHRIHYTDEGSGPPVLLVHSSGMSSRQWRKLAERLRPSHRVLTLDLLGSGASSEWPPDAPFTLDMDVRAVLAVAAVAGEPVHLVGHSYGGLLTIFAGLERAESVRSLAVYEPVLFGLLRPDGAERAELDRLARLPVFADPAHAGDADWYDAFIGYWNGPGAWAALPEPARAEFLRVGRKVWLEVTSLTRDTTGADRYAAIAAPTLVLCGERTTLAEREACAALTTALPHARLQLVAGAGHMGPLTHADLVNDAIAAHLLAH